MFKNITNFHFYLEVRHWFDVSTKKDITTVKKNQKWYKIDLSCALLY